MSDAVSPVPFLDVGAAYREIEVEVDDAVRRVSASGTYLLGAELEAFESEFAAHVEAKHAVGVGSGLDALTLALRALGVGAGDEVIVPAHTFIGTWLAVSGVGATPVPVEPDRASYNIDPARIEEAITARTRAIVPVHLYGVPADMAQILQLAREHDLRVVADAAQAHGARYQGSGVGALGDAVCWSFYPAKNLGAMSDGGAVTTDSEAVADRLRVLRNYGSSKKYVHDERGVNSRLDEMQAAILRVKLGRLDEWNLRRTAIAERYLVGLEGRSQLSLPVTALDRSPVWHLFVVRHPERDRLQAQLAAAGVQTLIHYPIPPHRQLAYRDLRLRTALPLTDRLADEVLSLPIGPHLSPDQVDTVLDALGHAGVYRP